MGSSAHDFVDDAVIAVDVRAFQLATVKLELSYAFVCMSKWGPFCFQCFDNVGLAAEMASGL